MKRKKCMLKKKTANLNIFLKTMKPLESFSDVDVGKYVDGLRWNSRIMGG